MMRQTDAVSIVVPTFNEADNVSLLVNRIDKNMRRAGLTYEIIFIDDHSTDGTARVIKKLQDNYPIVLRYKKGTKGKAYSLLEGFEIAQHGVICMIDADLQYPPEAISKMYNLLVSLGADLVITDRVTEDVSFVRRFVSAGFNFFFARILFGLPYDTQSGLKLFKKEVVKSLQLDPTPWSFDLEFIVKSLENGFKIISMPIHFSRRHAGEAKISVVKASYEIGSAAVTIRLNTSLRRVRRTYRLSNRLIKQENM